MGDENNLHKIEPTESKSKPIGGRLSTPEWITAISSAAAAFAAIGSLVVASAALRVASDTGDIKRAISTISSLAAQTKRQADNSGMQVAAIVKQFGEMQKQTAALQGSASASQGQLQEMQAQQRPQLAIAGINPTSNLRFDETGATLQLNLNMKNLGKSSAEYTEIHALFYSRTDDDVVQKQITACKTRPFSPVDTPNQGFNIAQGDTFPYPFWLHMGKDALAAWRTPTVNKPYHFPVPMIVGCVEYKYGNKRHHIPFIFEVDRSAPVTPERPYGYDSIDPNGGDVPAGQIILPIPPWFVGRAD